MNIGPDASYFTNTTDSKTIACGGTSTYYSKSMSIRYARYFAIFLKAASSGTINLKVEIEQSYQLPTTEGSADTAWAIKDSGGEVVSGLNDSNQHLYALSPAVSAYIRLKITGLSGNDASTTLEAIISVQSE